MRVNDITSYTEEKYKATKSTLKSLSEMSGKYYNGVDGVHNLEELKRTFMATLEYLATQYAEVRGYKSSTHVYLEEQRKRLKAESVEKMMAEQGLKRTIAENSVYAYQYYKDGVDLIEELKKFFLRVELLYDHYSRVLDAIIQSISIASKDFYQNKNS
jgi:hypothetical protein